MRVTNDFFINTIELKFVCRPVSGGSMNPARSIGPALVVHVYKGLWIYVVGPIVGAIAGAIAYNLLRSVGKPHSEFAEEAPLRNIVVG
jgi:aquaporin NIP